MTRDELLGATAGSPVKLGRYDVHGLLEAGGMGTVYAAVDREHGTPVALKTLDHLGAHHILRFKNEFRAAADLAHPNLVALYELSREGDLWYFTMERIEGVDFIRWLRSASGALRDSTVQRARSSAPTLPDAHLSQMPREPLVAQPVSAPDSTARLREALIQLARGVNALHAAGLLHLDIKPNNVLVENTGRVVLLDFGLTRPIRDVESSAELIVAGTPSSMAPEQFSGTGIGPPTDWYAVGLMLYRALTGTNAFEAEGVAATPFVKGNFSPTPPSELLPELPDDLSRLAVDLLASDPSRRPTGEEVLSRLEAATPAPGVGSLGDEPTRLVGRDSERRELAAALDLALGGAAVVAEVSGSSGVGKSALLDDLFVELDLDRALVLRGRCYERESVPYKAFDGMLDVLAGQLAKQEFDPRQLPRWATELALAFPVLGRVRPFARHVANSRPDTDSVVELRRRAVEALRELFETLAGARPLIVSVDDAQWVDVDSARLLARLLAPPLPPRFLLVLSYRPEELRANGAAEPFRTAVDRLHDRDDVQHMRVDVGPLSVEDAQALASVRLGTVGDEELASTIATESEGLPYFVEALARFATESQTSDGRSEVELSDVLARRVEALEPAQRRLVETLAVADSPIPLSVAFRVAELEGEGVMRALWSLQSGHFVRSTGRASDDLVELCHDRMRESVTTRLGPRRLSSLHEELGETLAPTDDLESSPWLFDAVRHLNAAESELDEARRQRVVDLNLAAGRRARQAVAFPIARACFAAGIEALWPDAWTSHYATTLALHTGAAEASYLTAAWDEAATSVAEIKAHARDVLDQMPAWTVQIDTCIAHLDYDGAVEAGLAALHLLGVDLPSHPAAADVGDAIGGTIAALNAIGPDRFRELAIAEDPHVQAAARILTRLGSAAYFGRPLLFVIIATTLVNSAIEDGLAPSTPYALSVFGIVLNSIEQFELACTWAQVALGLNDRFRDRSLNVRTRHCANNLVCNLLAPLDSTLAETLAIWEDGKAMGDVEYAAYSAHAYVHNGLYAGWPLDELWAVSQKASAFMKSYEQINALHLHLPFEQAVRCFTGRAQDPASLNGPGFDEDEVLAVAAELGARSAICLYRLVMGVVRYHFSTPEDASESLEIARMHIDGAPSTWHVPILRQYAALAIFGLAHADDDLLRLASDDIAKFEALAQLSPSNYEHRVALLSGARARHSGDLDAAVRYFDDAVSLADAGGWTKDVALAHELAAAAERERGDRDAADRRAQAAWATYARWGAVAKLPPGYST